MAMKADRWERLEDLYHAASALPAAQRVHFLDESCAGDGALREELESLLTLHTGDKDFLEQNAVHVAARLIAGDQADAGGQLSGATIGHFDILGKLGSGGMGVVFEALDRRLGRTVALKFLPPSVASDAKALDRFEREARAASALSHPNICTIYSIQDAGGHLFIEMERLDGQTLRERIAGKPLDRDVAVLLALQIVDGLEAAHAKGIVHRDLKPANIFCTARGTAKILDFGIAKLESVSDETGTVIGTDGYMSPEQAAGESVDSRTDLFSFGALLYEMVTGRAVFQRTASASIRDAILNDEPIPPRSLNSAIPAALERIILRSLRKNREQRYQRASEIRADLERLQQHARRRHRDRLAAVVLLVILAAGLALYYSLHEAGDVFANVRVRQLTHNTSENSVQSGAISPDGRFVAYSDGRGIHVQSMATGEARMVPDSANLPNDVTWDLAPGWLADGSGFVVNLLPGNDIARSSVWLVGASEPPRKIRDHARALCVSPDGSWIAFAAEGSRSDYRSIWLVDQRGQGAHEFFRADADSSIADLSWSPDGRRVVYLRTYPTGRTAAIETRDLVGSPASTILQSGDAEAVHGPVWVPDGRLLYSLEPSAIGMGAGTQPCTHWQMPISNTGRPLGKPIRLAGWLPQCVGSLGFTADGRRAVYLQSILDDAIHIADVDADGNISSSSHRLTSTEGRNIPSGWTPDSRSLVFVSDSDGRATLFRQTIDAEPPQRISQEPGIMGFARVTPDGDWVIYRRELSGRVQLMLVPITGGASREFTTGKLVEGGVRCAVLPSRVCVIAERSGDARQVVFSSIDTDYRRGPELTRVNADPDIEYRWALSPDGRRLAFVGATDPKIHVLTTTGLRLQDLEVRARKSLGYISWTSDSEGLLVPSVDGPAATLLSVDFQGNTRVLWRQAGAADISGIASPDGRHVALWVRYRHANLWLAERPE